MTFRIGKRSLDITNPAYFIADIAANHDGELKRAIDLIYLAKESGADCAKFQHFEAPSIVSDQGFKNLGELPTHQSNWTKSVAEIYDLYHTKREWDIELVKHCNRANIDFMTTPYNLEAVDFFKSHMNAFKVGSGDITYRVLLEKINETGKPVFLATGASGMADIKAALNFLNDVEVCIMQCNTNYTGDTENFKYVNLNVLRTFESQFPGFALGFSDHTPGHAAVLGAISLGAVAIEKHFTDDNNRIGPDHSFALNPKSWREMIDRARELEFALGDGVKRIEKNEMNSIIVQRRAIRAAKNLKIGTVLTNSDVEFLRPCESDAISPMNTEDILGKKLKVNLKYGECLKWRDIEL